MRKIIAYFAVAAAFGVCAVSYAAQTPITALKTDEVITFADTADIGDSVTAVFYDEDGRLIYASHISAENGEYKLTAPDEFSTVKIYDMTTGAYDLDISDAEPEVSISPSPQTTAAPSSTPEASPEVTRRPVNPSYISEADQRTAPGLVIKTATESDGSENYCAVTVLLQGEEVKIPVAEDKTIETAPQAYSYLIGSDAHSLQKGDVVYFRTNIAGDTVKGIDLIYRLTDISDLLGGSATFSEFFNGGSAAAKVLAGNSLTSDRAYVFGIVTDKSGDTLTIYPADGNSENIIEADYTSDTVTYIYDLSSKEDPYAARASAIVKSAIPNRAYDDDDNIAYSSEYTYTYALVRMSEKAAADIIIYINAEF